MSKVLLCLVSEQHVPNFLSVLHFQPDQIVLLVSPDMAQRNVHKNLVSALRVRSPAYGFGTGFKCPVMVEPVASVNDPKTIRDAIEKVCKKNPDAQWIVNYTGGNKPMSIEAHRYFEKVGAKLVYIDARKPDEMLIYDGDAVSCAYKPTSEEFLAGYGFDYATARNDIITRERTVSGWAQCARSIAYAGPGALWFSNGDAAARSPKGSSSLSWGDLKVRNARLRSEIATLFNLNEDRGSLVGDILQDSLAFLKGGWLEVFVWDTLTRYQQELGIWDVRLGVRTLHRATQVANELDVAFMYNWGLEIVECKAGGQRYTQADDTLYKLEAVGRQFGALRVRPYMVTVGSNVLTNTGRMKLPIAQRASLYDCRIIGRSEIKRMAAFAATANDVREVFGLSRPQT